jgi:hypothetical protein
MLDDGVRRERWTQYVLVSFLRRVLPQPSETIRRRLLDGLISCPRQISYVIGTRQPLFPPFPGWLHLQIITWC